MEHYMAAWLLVNEILEIKIVKCITITAAADVADDEASQQQHAAEVLVHLAVWRTRCASACLCASAELCVTNDEDIEYERHSYLK